MATGSDYGIHVYFNSRSSQKLVCRLAVYCQQHINHRLFHYPISEFYPNYVAFLNSADCNNISAVDSTWKANVNTTHLDGMADIQSQILKYLFLLWRIRQITVGRSTSPQHYEINLARPKCLTTNIALI